MRQAGVPRFGFLAARIILAALCVLGLFHEAKVSAAPRRDAEPAITDFKPVLTYKNRVVAVTPRGPGA